MLHRGTNLILGGLVCLAVCASAPLAAQEAPPPAAAAAKEQEPSLRAGTPAAETPRRIEESFPSIYYLKDEHGKLQAVPNFTLKEFEDLFKIKNQLVQGDPRPRFSLQQMLASGTVNSAGQAELTVQFRIFVREDQWTRVPLRLDQAVLREPAQYQGPGEHLLSFEREGEGYVAWIHGPAGQTHELTLKLLVPLTGAGQETRLHLTAPRTTASELRLKAPYTKAVARASEGATLQTSRAGNRETELIADGLNGEFELSWHPPGAAPGKPAALEASGTIISRLDGRGVETEAAFSVRSYGEPFDQFHIRLPAETDLVPGNPSGYSLTAINAGGGTAASVRQRTVEVQLARRTVGPVEIHFSTKRVADMTRVDHPLELAGFEIPEAARQGGTIVVSVAGDWQVVWGASRGVRQVDQTPESVRQKDVVAVYEYFALPSSLTARLVTRKTRINVEPEYIILVDNDQVRLEARFRYSVRGAKVAAVNIAMPDWQIDEVGPDSVVAADGVPAPAGYPATGMSLALPLLSPTVGQFEVHLKAHRALAAEAKSITVAFPQPQASAPAAATVAVLPADNVEIIPMDSKTIGLLRQDPRAGAPPLMLDLPARQQEPLFYRTDAPQAVFKAELRRHQRRTTVAVSSQVTVGGPGPTNGYPGYPGYPGPRVEQKFSYSIAYEPTDYLLLDVPRELAGSGKLELTCDDQVLAPVSMGEESSDGDPGHPGHPRRGSAAEGPGAPPLRMRIGLPKSCIGRCDVTARFALPTGRDTGSGLRVPLVMPVDAELSANVLTVVAAEEQQVEVVGGDWTADPPRGYPDAGGAVPPPRARAFSSPRPAAEVVLNLRGGGGEAPVIVERAWLQTRLAKSTATRDATRQDRLVVQVLTRRRQLEIALPPGADFGQAAVRISVADRDGLLRKQPDELPPGPASGYPGYPAAGTGGDHVLAVRLPVGNGTGRYVLDLQYRVAGERAGQGPLQLALPRVGDAWVAQMYWQLLLPPEEHLVTAPRDLTGEFVWRWNGFYYGRQPVMGPADLERWVGLPHAGSAPDETGMNSYLFSTLGWTDSCEIVTAGRSAIVLIASGVALLAGLALIYLRAARHPVVLLVAVVLLAGGAARYPELALLAAQAAVLGLVLSLLALVLRQWLGAVGAIALPEVASAATQSLHGPGPSPPASGYPGGASSELPVPVAAASSSKGSSRSLDPSLRVGTPSAPGASAAPLPTTDPAP